MATDAPSPLLERAIALHTAGRLDEAEALYRRVLDAQPREARAAHPLGVILLGSGRLDEAVAILARAVDAAPRWAEAQNNYGVALREVGRLADAARAFRAATLARPAMFDAHNNLAEALLELDAPAEAFDAATSAHALDPSRASPLVTLGIVHLLRREASSAVGRLRAALALEPGNRAAAELYRVACSRLVEPWHFAMLNDRPRNDAYDAAIRRAVRPGDLVLDIGAGSGLLSMMAARAGAGRVVACEASAALADKAREVVARNGLAERVAVHALHSTELRVGEHLPARADVLVAEVLDSNVLGEGVLASFDDAHARLLVPGARVVPRAASARVVLAGGEGLARTIRVDRSAGFDVSALNEFQPERVIFDGTHLAFERYSEPVTALRFDLSQPAHPPGERVIDVPVTASGECVGVVQWLHIELDDAHSYENRPERWEDNPGNWLHSFHPFPRAVRVEKGGVLRVLAGHGLESLYFRVE